MKTSREAKALPCDDRSVEALRAEIEQFLAASGQPAILEPGDDVFPVQPGEYTLEADGEGLLLECWGAERTLRRRIRGIRKRARNRLELDAERFPRKRCTLSLVDLHSVAGTQVRKESWRGIASEELRRWCERLYTGWQTESLSAAPDLENSLSARFPRALLRRGGEGVCAISAPAVEGAEDVFTFSLVWLQHCRQRCPQLRVRTLLLFVPETAASTVALRLTALCPDRVQCRLLAVSADGVLRELCARSWGNLNVQVANGHPAPVDERLRQLFRLVASRSEAECVEDLRGVLHLELRGLPLARAEGSELRAGLKLKRRERWPSAEWFIRLAGRVASLRHASPADARHALYRLYPERWLESMVRQHIRVIDPSIQPWSIRRQVAGTLGTQHHRTDLLATDENGRLVIVEVKASEDIHVVAQALDYYGRFRLHLNSGGLAPALSAAGLAIAPLPPRVLLVAPALSFHPSNETVLEFLESSIQVRQVGLALEWRRQMRVVFQRESAGAAAEGGTRWPGISSSKFARH